MHFFVNEIKGDLVEITGEDAFHLAVTRKRLLQQTIKVISMLANVWVEGEVIASNSKVVQVKILKRFVKPNRRMPQIILYQALIKSTKLELILQKATELGVSEIVLFNAERSVRDIGSLKNSRYQRIVKEAAMQSESFYLPEIKELNKLEFVPSQKGIFFEARLGLPGLLPVLEGSSFFSQVALVIGPEGGLTESEQQILLNKGLSGASLGPSILRAETAAISALSVVNAFYNR